MLKPMTTGKYDVNGKIRKNVLGFYLNFSHITNPQINNLLSTLNVYANEKYCYNVHEMIDTEIRSIYVFKHKTKNKKISHQDMIILESFLAAACFYAGYALTRIEYYSLNNNN